jgi:uncharacterized membrane protein
VIRALLVTLTLILLRGADLQLHLVQQTEAMTYRISWEWLGWIVLLCIAGFSFGLACWLPRRLAYAPLRVLLLGTAPLLMLATYAMLEGPTSLVRFTANHVRVLQEHPFFFDAPPGTGLAYLLAFMLGVALASGFAPDRA